MTKECLCPSWPSLLFASISSSCIATFCPCGPSILSATRFQQSHPKCRGKTQQNSISNTYTPSAKQGGPEQPRGSPQRSRSVVHRRLHKDAATQNREATKRGLRSAAALAIRNALRTKKTKINGQCYRHFKTAASKHCCGLASLAMLHPKAQDTSTHNNKSCRYQAYRNWFRHLKNEASLPETF